MDCGVKSAGMGKILLNLAELLSSSRFKFYLSFVTKPPLEMLAENGSARAGWSKRYLARFEILDFLDYASSFACIFSVILILCPSIFSLKMICMSLEASGSINLKSSRRIS